MKRLAVLTIIVCLAVPAMSETCTTIDFEDIPTGTSVEGPGAVSDLLTITGTSLEVVEEGQGSGILAYNANVGGNSNSVANWLPGDNDKSFGNPSTLRGLDSQDLTITFNPGIVVNSFTIEFFDYGDWFPAQGNTGTGTPTLKAFDVADNELDSSSVSVTYGSDNDVWDLWNATGNGAISLTVTGSDIAYVTLTFDRMDPGMTFDNIAICYEWYGDSATGLGERIRDKGSWFMYNCYADPTVDVVDDPVCFDIHAGNPEDYDPVGSNIIGSYCVTDNGDGTYTVTEDIDDTIMINGVEYEIWITDKHLAIQDDHNDFTGKPGKDENQEFGTAFSDADGVFCIFAHFEVEYRL